MCELTIDIDRITSNFVDSTGKIIDTVIIKKGSRLKRNLQSDITEEKKQTNEESSTNTTPKSEIEELMKEYDKSADVNSTNVTNNEQNHKEVNHESR